jgi:GNAT superfamily N-acetyltransferase
MPVLIKRADPFGPAAHQLVQEMVAEIPQRYGEVLDAAALAERSARVLGANAAFTGDRSVFLVATVEGQTAGCGALQPINSERDAEIGEVKRMYVTRSVRRRGVGAAILAALEEQAHRFGYRRLRLETGDQQPEAVALYAASGWVRIEAFGNYADDATSLCFEKVL